MLIFIENGSLFNLIPRKAYDRLENRPIGKVQQISIKGKELKIDGLRIALIRLQGALLYHEFLILQQLPVNILICGNILNPH